MLNDSVTSVNWVSQLEILSPYGADSLLNQATCTIHFVDKRKELISHDDLLLW